MVGVVIIGCDEMGVRLRNSFIICCLPCFKRLNTQADLDQVETTKDRNPSKVSALAALDNHRGVRVPSLVFVLYLLR